MSLATIDHVTRSPRARGSPDVLTREEIRIFSRPVAVRLIFDLSLIWLQAILGIAIFAYLNNIVGFVIGIALVGSAQHGMGLVAHEGVHHLIVPRRKFSNDLIARWLFAAPVLLPFTLYRQRHLLHHALVSTDDDTKELYRRDIRGVRLLLEFLTALLGVDYVRQVVSTLRRDYGERVGAGQQDRSVQIPAWVKEDLPPFACLQLTLLGTLWLVDPLLYPLMWLLPNVTVSPLCSKLRSLVEHRPSKDARGVKPGSGYYLDTETPCLRSVRATWLERIFLSKINFHFHAEHHLWPFVSYQYLPILHDRVLHSSEAQQMGFTVESSYVAAIHKLWSGK
jgi:fatty acid desaturase